MSERDITAEAKVDFDMAEEFLRVAKASHASGNVTAFAAALKMICVSLGIKTAPADDLQRAWIKR